MKLNWGMIGAILLLVATWFGVGYLFLHKPSSVKAEQNQTVAVSSAGVSATSVVADNAVKAEAVDAQVRKGTRSVQSAPNAKDDMGAVGLAGISALCSMSNYQDDPSCKLQQSGAKGLEERSTPRTAPSG